MLGRRSDVKECVAAFATAWSRLLSDALDAATPTAYFDFFAFPKCILLSPPRGGKRISKQVSLADLVQQRMLDWPTKKADLWNEVVLRGKQRKEKVARVLPEKPPLEKAVVKALRLGDVRKALQLFNSAPIAPKTQETFDALRALHPESKSPVSPPTSPVSAAPIFEDKVVSEALATFSPCTSAGVFGYRPRLLQQCARSSKSLYFVSTLTRCVNMLAQGRAPPFLQPFVAGGVSIALSKGEKGVRPLCCGDSLRRLVAKCFCHGGKDEIAKSFKGENFGVGCPGGVEVVAHSLRDTLRRHKDSDFALLKIDFRNAFNLLERDTFVKAASARFPGMELWTRWCYQSPPLLIYNHEHLFYSACGVQQGDPLGPLYFCCGLQSLVDKIKALNPVYQKWYMDDGGIVGPVDLLLKAWNILKTDGPPLGLHLNALKCEWSWLNEKCTGPCPIEGVPVTPTAEIQMLGVPLGSDDFVAGFVKKNMIPTTQEVCAKLEDFEDTQSAMYLLRLSYGIIRANHFMRTTPLLQWSVHAVEFDKIVLNTTQSILGCTLPPLLMIRLVSPLASAAWGFEKLWIMPLSPSAPAGVRAKKCVRSRGCLWTVFLITLMVNDGLRKMWIALLWNA